jgi:hypothetical protein
VPDPCRYVSQPADVEHPPEPDENGFGRVITQRRRTAHLGPYDDVTRHCCSGVFGGSTVALFTRIEELATPYFGTDLAHQDAATRCGAFPDLSQWPTAFEYEPEQMRYLPEQGVRATP